MAILDPTRSAPPGETVDATAGGTSRSSGAALDWFTFFCANLQTGFGPFVSVYLTAEKWTQTDIGLVLMVGGLVGLVGQMPGGLLVDASRSKVLVAGIAVAAIGGAGLAMALGSVFAIILFAWVLHAAASCVLNPSITTISLGLVGHGKISGRLGRNAMFASAGNALGAAGMGACGYYFSNRAVFFVTAALAVPALVALVRLGRVGITAPAALPSPSESVERDQTRFADWKSLLGNRPLVILALVTALFTLSNAAMLPLVGSVLTLRSAQSPTLLIAACIIVPQLMVTVLSPVVGRKAQTWGRRPLLIIGMAALPLRGFCLGIVTDPHLFVFIQMLDGISSAVLGVMIPLVAADATRKTGGYALAQGAVGTAIGLGASFSSTIAGIMTDRLGSTYAFNGLTGIALVGFLVTIVLMPETREPRSAPR
jgi:MFS family permease